VSTYVVYRGSVLGQLNHLDGDVVANVEGHVCGQRDLRQADCAGVLDVRGASYREGWDDVVGHVWRCCCFFACEIWGGVFSQETKRDSMGYVPGSPGSLMPMLTKNWALAWPVGCG